MWGIYMVYVERIVRRVDMWGGLYQVYDECMDGVYRCTGGPSTISLECAEIHYHRPYLYRVFCVLCSVLCALHIVSCALYLVPLHGQCICASVHPLPGHDHRTL